MSRLIATSDHRCRPHAASEELVVRQSLVVLIVALGVFTASDRAGPPGALILHKHSDAQFLLRWQRLPLGIDEATQLIGDVGERNVRSDESHRHSQRLERNVATSGLEDRR